MKKSWLWIPSLYFAEGLPYVIVMSVAVIMFKRLGISNTDIALYTSWLYIPWVIKPLWSPIVDIFKTKRWWILITQIIIGAGLAGIVLTLPGPNPFRYSLAFLWLLAFSSATHDIAIDGFYMLALDKKEQAYYIGIRNTFYRLSTIGGQGLLVMLAGLWEISYGASSPAEIAVPKAWSNAFYVSAIIFGLFFIYHNFMLPHPPSDKKISGSSLSKTFLESFGDFFRKKQLLSTLAFILLYRFAESQLAKLASPFLLDAREKGGLGLDTLDVGFIYGTMGIIALTAGGIIGGVLIARNGLKYWVGWMAIAMNLPNLVYLYMAYARPENMALISSCVAFEQFGYGFGFTSLIYYMIQFSEGKYQTAHYALCTGFMAFGMMLPGMISGWIQEHIGYQHFFIWIMLCTIPSFITVAHVQKQLKTTEASKPD